MRHLFSSNSCWTLLLCPLTCRAMCHQPLEGFCPLCNLFNIWGLWDRSVCPFPSQQPNWSHLCQSWAVLKEKRWAALAATWMSSSPWSRPWRLRAQNVARSTAAGRTTCIITVWRWTTTLCATSACSRWCSRSTHHADTPSAPGACAASYRRGISALWTGQGCSCRHAADPASLCTSC